ncbi:MAG TPA: metallophosphoesterase [Calditerricola sp.]
MWFLLLLVGLLALVLYGHRNTYRFTLKRIHLPLNRRVPCPQRLTILHLSDLHMENISISPEDLYNQLKNERIDLIALTGDYLDQAQNIEKFLTYVEILQRLNPPYGIYAVFGNHDYVLEPEALAYLKREMTRRGVHVLQNASRTLSIDGQTLTIIGVDDFSTRRSDLARAYKGVDESSVCLVLTHDPNLVLHMDGYPCDYLLSGHFHGGQIHWPKPFHLVKMGALPRRNIIRGLHVWGEKAFYISEGLGQTALNIRLRSRPEVTLHTIGQTQHSA